MKTNLALALAVTLAGCGSPSFDIADQTDPAIETASPPSDAATPEAVPDARTEIAPPDAELGPETAPDDADAFAPSVDAHELDDTRPIDSAAVDSHDATHDAASCWECVGHCSKPNEDHACSVSCLGLGKKHCTYDQGPPVVCGCND